MSTHIRLVHNAEAAHRIPILDGAGAKCRNLHGHSWHLEWTFDATGVPVEQIEFGAVKLVLRHWVDTNFDHGAVLHEDDPDAHYLIGRGSKVWALPVWPTTEAIAEHLAAVTAQLLPEQTLVSVLVREGAGNTAIYYPERSAK